MLYDMKYSGKLPVTVHGFGIVQPGETIGIPREISEGLRTSPDWEWIKPDDSTTKEEKKGGKK
jgi:hypothetical protein